MDIQRTESLSAAQAALPTAAGASQERPHFRRELYARSTDRSTVEDMADMVVHRVIGQAATCIEKSLGMKFCMENLKISSIDDEMQEAEDEFQTSDSVLEDKRNKRLKRSSKAGQLVDLPNSSDFNQEKGLPLVEQLVDSWDLNCALWERQTELVTVEETPNCATYKYKTVFFPVSKAKRYIQITASVDFNLIVNHLDGGSPIKVDFRLEGQRFKHEPGQFRFREKWLLDIIEHKKKLIRQVSL